MKFHKSSKQNRDANTISRRVFIDAVVLFFLNKFNGNKS